MASTDWARLNTVQQLPTILVSALASEICAVLMPCSGLLVVVPPLGTHPLLHHTAIPPSSVPSASLQRSSLLGQSKSRTSAAKALWRSLPASSSFLSARSLFNDLSRTLGLTGAFLFASTTARSSNALLGWNCGYTFNSNVRVFTARRGHTHGNTDHVWCLVRHITRDFPGKV